MTEDQLNELTLQHYRNSTEVRPALTVEDITKACLIGRLNLLLLGETGEGKTQLENDILGIFGNNGFFELGRNDLTVKEIFTRLRLDRLREAKTSDEIREITENAGHPVYVIDEITRCIPAVQNQFFNMGDGFFTDQGAKHQLGTLGYSILVASGNIGNGRYTGTSEMDRALRDRMHVTLDLDYFPTTPTDTLDVLLAKRDPRVSEAENTDHTEAIVQLNAELEDEPPTIMQYLAAMYFKHALDYCQGIPGESKRKNKNAWPGIVQGHATGGDEAVIYPFSTRAAISTLTLSQALKKVRGARGVPYDSSTEAVLDAAYLVGTHSGVLHPSAVDSQYDGNPYRAMDAVLDGIRAEFVDRQELLHEAVSEAQKGKLIHEGAFTGRWQYTSDILTDLARQAKTTKE